jgi:hypothetical protein
VRREGQGGRQGGSALQGAAHQYCRDSYLKTLGFLRCKPFIYSYI